jgi:predicted TIM-barrel fold metal-dependent hydrolase
MAGQIIDACAQMGSGDKTGDLLEYDIKPERVLQNMDQAGISKSVVFPITWNRYTAAANREIAEAVKTHPDRLVGFARVNPTASDAPKLFLEAIETHSMRGVRLRPYHDRFQLRHPGVRKIIDIAREHELLVATDGEKDRSELTKIVQEYPQVNFILMHLGSFDNWVWQNGKAYMELMEKTENFYMASCFEIIHFFLEEAINRNPDKVILGSDSPNLPPAMELKRIEVMKLSPDKHALVVGGTIAELLGL